MNLWDWLFGSDMKKIPTQTKSQQQFTNQLLSSLMGGQLGNLYGEGLEGMGEWLDPSSASYQRFAAPYMQQFNQETIPGLAERFAGMSPMGGGALSSSGFGQSLGSAGANLQTQLAGLKSQMQRQSINDILGQYQNMASLGLGQRPFGYKSPQQGFLPSLAMSAASGMGKAAMGGF